MQLNVLVVESEPAAATAAVDELRAAGHTVLTCHDPGRASFPCRGVVDPSICPLRSHAVDVALLVRSGARARPTLDEDGARCALVQRVPLVVAGEPVLDPFADYATRTVSRTYDVVDACELAASAPIAALGRRANEVLSSVLGAGHREPAPEVRVIRRHGRLQAQISNGASMTAGERARAAVRITGALRELDPFAAGIDVGAEGPDPVDRAVAESTL